MSFLEKLFPKQQPVKPSRIEFILAKHFRGFKRFPIVIYGDETAEKNNELLKDSDMIGHTISFQPGFSTTYKGLFYTVHIDNMKIGAIFDNDQVRAISKGLFSEIYARSEEESTISGKKIVKRHHMKLFVKYEENEA